MKNLVGTFHPASLLLVCPAALATLRDREYRSGLAEVIKTAVIGDPSLLDLLEAGARRCSRVTRACSPTWCARACG